MPIRQMYVRFETDAQKWKATEKEGESNEYIFPLWGRSKKFIRPSPRSSDSDDHPHQKEKRE